MKGHILVDSIYMKCSGIDRSIGDRNELKFSGRWWEGILGVTV